MRIDAKKIEMVLPAVLRRHGIRTTDYHGVQYVGMSETIALETGVKVPSLPTSKVVSLAELAQDIAEALA
ncbi:hypothetical protein AB7M45_007851 [Bradyrhizobium elkanii]|uniref:hypothetical protein n=1 Tax=Bradyrhizobium elkanii TaxID=29448 RepID=UPI00091EFFA8|nr:hypothetical protein [Bradyrhizobium elkanii]MCW2195079.1 hypothetical protein [Bradyrhizobium elkanii]NWL67229.1 hypothetical protein [Bradyrhizobium elkanii]OIM94104.1 hypothetical protein BLN97_12585 [Bradyrhizobium elkanii]